jgi:hypothetical protein
LKHCRERERLASVAGAVVDDDLVHGKFFV